MSAYPSGGTEPTLYDAAHRAARARWQARMDAGEVVLCARGCGQVLNGGPWDLGHTRNRQAHSGPECIECNRSTNAHRAAARRRPRRAHPSDL